jgi:signal transduction histidine kinase
MGGPLRVLIVDDSEDDAELLLHELRRGGYEPTWKRVDHASGMTAALAESAWDLVIADYRMPRFSALDALTVLQASGLDLPFVIVSGAIGEDTAVRAMKAGAHDYIMKDNLARLTPVIARELRDAETRQERKHLEAQVLQSQKLEAVGRLASGVAHDFNNLLTVIVGRSEFVRGRLARHDLPHQDVDLIIATAKRAATLTRQLLAFSRKQMLQSQVLDLNAVVTGIEPMLSRLIGEHIHLRLALAPGLGAVKADPGQFEQIIVNLVINARDAMSGGGRLVIETGNVELDDADCRRHEGLHPGPHVMITVSDTGVGMSAETQAHLFEPFFTTKGPDGGTGLGLATVYGIVGQSGGAISVASDLGRGASFSIYLPRVEEPVAPIGRVKPVTGSADGSETVLLVEDEEEVRAVARLFLQTHGYTVLEARHGDEALAISAHHRGSIDLLVTDLVMPRMGGRELVRRLAPARPRMKVLYVSGYSDHTVLSPDALGAPFLEKPFASDVLARKVREVLDAH